MSEEERWCGDAGEEMIFFFEIDLAAGYITKTVAWRSGDLQMENIMRPSAQLPACNMAPRSPQV